jgi:hypothetical protein
MRRKEGSQEVPHGCGRSVDALQEKNQTKTVRFGKIYRETEKNRRMIRTEKCTNGGGERGGGGAGELTDFAEGAAAVEGRERRRERGWARRLLFYTVTRRETR